MGGRGERAVIGQEARDHLPVRGEADGERSGVLREGGGAVAGEEGILTFSPLGERGERVDSAFFGI